MKTMSVAAFKSQFSEVIQAIVNGQEIAVSYGKKHETIGVFVPISKFIKKKRSLGILKNKASFSISSDFKMKDEDFLKQ